MTVVVDSVQLDRLWDYDDPAGSEARFRAALEQLAIGGSLYVETVTQIARAQGLQRQFEAAHSTLDTLTAWPTLRSRLRYWLERGRVFNSSGERAQARDCFQTAFDLGQGTDEEFYTIDAAHMLAIAADSAESALAWNEHALRLTNAASDPRARGWQASLANNLGWTYHDLGDYRRALDLFEQALAARRLQGDQTRIRIARWCVARAWRSLGRIAEALAWQRDLHAEWQANGSVDGYVLEEIGECLLLLNQAAAARPYFQQAYAILAQDDWLAAAEPQRLARLHQLGETI